MRLGQLFTLALKTTVAFSGNTRKNNDVVASDSSNRSVIAGQQTTPSFFSSTVAEPPPSANLAAPPPSSNPSLRRIRNPPLNPTLFSALAADYFLTMHTIKGTPPLDEIAIRRRRATARDILDVNQRIAEIDLSESEVFRLLGLTEPSPVTDTERFIGEEPGSVRDLLETYCQEKIKHSDDPILKHLITHDYLRYPTKLEMTYRIAGYSAGEPSIQNIRCPNGALVNSPKQQQVGYTMANAIRRTAQAISRHTPFSLHEANATETTDVFLLTTVCANTPDTWSGKTISFSNLVHEKLSHPALGTLGNQSFTFEQIGRVAEQLRQRYADKSYIIFKVGENFHPSYTPGSIAWNLALHELGHALGLLDVTVEQRIQGLEEYYLARPQAILDNTVMAYDSMPVLPPSYQQTRYPYPQSLMPYDYAALDEVAAVVHAQSTGPATSAQANSLRHKSPYRGDTYYRITRDNAIEVIDYRPSASAGNAYLIAPSKTSYMQMTLVDPHGYDTLDFSALNFCTHVSSPLSVMPPSIDRVTAGTATMPPVTRGVSVDLRPGGAVIYNRAALAYSEAVEKTTGQPLSYFARGNLYFPLSNRSMYLIEAVIGSLGDDIVHGNRLTNSFALGKGDDIVTGGGGCDSFAFRRGDQQLTITDFNVACDHLALHPNLGIRNYRQLIAHTYKDGKGNLNIRLPRRDLIVLKNIADKYQLRPKNLIIYGYAKDPKS